MDPVSLVATPAATNTRSATNKNGSSWRLNSKLLLVFSNLLVASSMLPLPMLPRKTHAPFDYAPLALFKTNPQTRTLYRTNDSANYADNPTLMTLDCYHIQKKTLHPTDTLSSTGVTQKTRELPLPLRETSPSPALPLADVGPTQKKLTPHSYGLLKFQQILQPSPTRLISNILNLPFSNRDSTLTSAPPIVDVEPTQAKLTPHSYGLLNFSAASAANPNYSANSTTPLSSTSPGSSGGLRPAEQKIQKLSQTPSLSIS